MGSVTRTKSVSLDLEAYERLKAVQKEEESLSDTIKRLIGKPEDVEEWLRRIGENPLLPETTAAIEEQISQRRSPQKMTRPPRRADKRRKGR